MIGLFDSGHGGLTVLKAVARALPGEALVYLGDHGHAPYGERSSEEICTLTTHGVERLFELGCSLVVLACNTASAVALRRIQQQWLPRRYSERRVLGVLVPLVEAVTGIPWHQEAPSKDETHDAVTVAIFATTRTVTSGAYPEEIAKRAPWIRVVQQACPRLAAAIEEGRDEATLGRMIDGYVAELTARLGGREPDWALLGCTHYPLVAELFAARLAHTTQVHCQPSLVADSLVDYLRRRPAFASGRATGGTVTLYTTGDPESCSQFASVFLGGAVRYRALPPDAFEGTEGSPSRASARS